MYELLHYQYFSEFYPFYFISETQQLMNTLYFLESPEDKRPSSDERKKYTVHKYKDNEKLSPAVQMLSVQVCKWGCCLVQQLWHPQSWWHTKQPGDLSVQGVRRIFLKNDVYVLVP